MKQRKRTKTGNSTIPKLGQKSAKQSVANESKKKENPQTVGQRQTLLKATSTCLQAKLKTCKLGKWNPRPKMLYYNPQSLTPEWSCFHVLLNICIQLYNYQHPLKINLLKTCSEGTQFFIKRIFYSEDTFYKSNWTRHSSSEAGWLDGSSKVNNIHGMFWNLVLVSSVLCSSPVVTLLS